MRFASVFVINTLACNSRGSGGGYWDMEVKCGDGVLVVKEDRELGRKR